MIEEESAARFGFAYDQVTGEDVQVTGECLADFVQCMTSEHQDSLTTDPYLKSQRLSDYELIGVMFDRGLPDSLVAAATRELAARYIDSDGTKAAIQRICLEMGK